MGGCVSTNEQKLAKAGKQLMIKAKQAQIDAVQIEVQSREKSIEFLKGENDFIRERISEAKRDLWHEEKQRLKSQNLAHLEEKELRSEIYKLEKIIFEKQNLTKIMKGRYDELNEKHSKMITKKRKHRRRCVTPEYQSYSDH